MKESYGEGVAIHTGPESCGGGSNAMAEALTGVRAGRVLSREILLKSRVPTSWDVAEGNIGRVVSARHIWTLRGRRPRARTETSCTGTGRSHNRPQNGSLKSALGTPRGHARDVRKWEVGQPHITREAPNNGHGAPCPAEVVEERGLAKGNSAGQTRV